MPIRSSHIVVVPLAVLWIFFSPLADAVSQEGAVPQLPTVSVKADCLFRTYKDFIDKIETINGRQFFVMKNGDRHLLDDGRQKSFEELLSAPDLEDQFAISYPAGKIELPRSENADPGRIRVEAFFASVYGKTKEEVQSNLVAVDWPAVGGTQRLRFNQRAGAAAALSKVSKSLRNLDGKAMKASLVVGGTFNHRFIAGTNRLSAHAFGIAVDVDVHHSAYWRWSKNLPRFVNNIPWSVIDIFEQNGFIWGGKWYHFDTMHFEYRPELFCNSAS